MKTNNILLLIILPIVLIFLSLSNVKAQFVPMPVATPPIGNPLNLNVDVSTETFGHELHIDQNEITSSDGIHNFSYGNPTDFDLPEHVWSPPPPLTMINVSLKKATAADFGNERFFNVLLSNGSVWSIAMKEAKADPGHYPHMDVFKVKQIAYLPSSQEAEKLLDGTLYMLYPPSTFVASLFVSRDTGNSWQVDTTGLNGESIYDIVMDSAESVWCVTNSGLWKQGADDTVWHTVSGFPHAQFPQTVFVDRMKRIWVGSYYGPMVSTDSGATWKLDTAGITTVEILRFGDDSYGNIYGFQFVTRLKLFRQSKTGGAWQEIDAGLHGFASDSSVLINSIGGDSVLLAATDYGAYASKDQGATWIKADSGIHARNILALVKTKSGAIAVTTAMGAFIQQSGNWIKVYPKSGFQHGQNLYIDNNDDLIIYDQHKSVSFSNDLGNSWKIDTGIHNIEGKTAFTVDENQVEHIASGMPYVKPVNGGTWNLDTMGLNITAISSNNPFAMASDGHGKLWVSGSTFGSGNVLKRPIGGGSWKVDTTGLSETTQLYSLIADRAGNMIGTSGYGLYRHQPSGSWVSMPFPNNKNYFINTISVDSNNVLFASFATGIGDIGVYYTLDNGANWTFAGLDGLSVNALVSYGDITYALTTNGLFALTASKASAIASFNTQGVDFGRVAPGATKDTLIRIYNRGGAALKFTNIQSSNPVFHVESTTMSIGPVDSTIFDLQYQPLSPQFDSGTVIYTSSDGTITNIHIQGTESSSDVRPEVARNTISISDPIPNPTGSTTEITYELPEALDMSLDLIDLLGNEVQMVQTGFKDAGIHHITLDLSKIPTGIYYYRLHAGSNTITKALLKTE